MDNSSNSSIEDPKLAQEAIDKKRELDLKEREIVAKERDVASKERELNRSPWLNPTVIGLFIAALGLLGSVIVARVNNANNQEVERLQSEANITLEAIKTGTGNTDASCKNLTFFVGLGLIRDPENRIQYQCSGVVKGPPSLPSGPTPPAPSRQPVPQAVKVLHGELIDVNTGLRIPGATISIVGKTNHFQTDSNGIFAIPAPDGTKEGDQFSIKISKQGYKSEVVQIVASHSDWPVDIFLTHN